MIDKEKIIMLEEKLLHFREEKLRLKKKIHCLELKLKRYERKQERLDEAKSESYLNLLHARQQNIITPEDFEQQVKELLEKYQSTKPEVPHQ